MSWFGTNPSSVALHYLSAALLIPSVSALGKLCQRHLKLALITGYFLSGVLFGPNCFNFLKEGSVRELEAVEKVCLGLIGISAGSELDLKDLRRVGKQIVALVGSLCVATWVFVFASTLVLLPKSSLGDSVTAEKMPVLASIVATIMMARSPASAIAVLKELDASGPFSTLSLAVIIVKDVLVIVAFSINLGLARISFNSGGSSALSGIIDTLFKINVAAAIGVFGALLIKQAFLIKAFAGSMRREGVFRASALILTAATVFYASEELGSEPLLACLILGATVVNLDATTTAMETGFVSALHNIMPTIYLIFFTLAGASVHIDTLPSFFQPAFFVYSARLLSLYAGARIGTRLGHCGKEHGENGWMAYVTQAGIAMGLSKSVLLQFPDWAGPFYTFLVCIIIMNQITGPTMYKATVISHGEAEGVPVPGPLVSK